MPQYKILTLSFWILILYILLDGRFPEWLEAGDPLHWRKWPVSVLQWPCELHVLNYEGCFIKSKLWWHSGAYRAPQSSLMISPFKLDRSLEENNKALWTELRLFPCISVRWGRTRFLFLANSVIPKNKCPLHEAKNSSGVNSASSPSPTLPF